MIVEPYQNCQGCGGDLDKTTMYRRHAYCTDCNRTAELFGADAQRLSKRSQ